MVFSPPPPQQPVQASADIVSESILSQVQEITKVSERTPPSHVQTQQNQGAQSGSGASSSGSPPKLTRERVAFPPRRRLFSRPDEEPGGGVSGGSVCISSGSGSLAPPRDSSGLRSSSETSVFDFRDSDSEGEMPVLEMQTLGEMRRDRKSHTKHQTQATSVSVSEVVELSEEGVIDAAAAVTDVHKEMESRSLSPLDPCWSAACDKFLEQLQMGVAKRKCRRKRTVAELKAVSNKIDDRSETIEMKLDVVEDEKETGKTEEKQEVIEEEKNKSEKKKTEKLVMKEKKQKFEDSDEDVPLIKRRGRPKKKDSSDGDVEDEISLAEIKARLGRADKSVSVEVPKNVGSRCSRNSSSSSNNSSSSIVSSDDEEDEEDSDSHEETVAERLRRRKRQGKEGNDEDGRESIGMRLRSKALCTLQKGRSSDKEKRSESSGKSGSKKKKPQFGDGSDFRPGWEEEVYRFKRSLRMPAQLINIPRPPHTHRLSASLPDLDPYPNSPAASTLDSADFTLQRRHLRPGGSLDRRHGAWSSVRSDLVDSDLDSSSNLSAAWHHARRTDDLGGDSEEATSSTTVSTKLKNNANIDNNNSILNFLVHKYSHSKSPRKKSCAKNSLSERSGLRIIPRSSSGSELLPTPSLGIGLKKSPSSKVDNKKVNLQVKKHKSKMDTGDLKGEKGPVCDIKESVYLGYFRKKTVTNFRDAFRQNGGILAEDFAPIVFKSRTRTQTRVLRQRATIREVFGDDRPASAPPICNEERVHIQQSENSEWRRRSVREDTGTVSKNRSCAITGGRPGLRSAGLRRSNKAVLNSKRHLLRRDHDLLRAVGSKKTSFKNTSRSLGSVEPVTLVPPVSRESSVTKASTAASSPPSSTSHQMVDGMIPPNGKRIKLRSVRRKFRSGFDYIRKKKKQQKREGDAEGNKDKKKVLLS